MSAVDTILRIIAVPVAIVVISISAWVGVLVLDPFTATMPAPAGSLGWPEYSYIYRFFALAIVGIIFVVLAWLWVSPIKEDVRQEQQGPF